MNDVAVIFPPEAAPIYLVVFTDGDCSNLKSREAGIAEVTRIVLSLL